MRRNTRQEDTGTGRRKSNNNNNIRDRVNSLFWQKEVSRGQKYRLAENNEGLQKFVLQEEEKVELKKSGLLVNKYTETLNHNNTLMNTYDFVFSFF